MRYLLSFFIFLFAPSLVFAESLSFTLSDDEIEVGDQVAVTVVSTTAVSVNTIDGRLVLPEGFEIVAMKTELSPIQFWVESPMDAKNSTIRFTGFSTNGFSGTQPLLTLVLRTRREGAASIHGKNLALFAHDGLGTPIQFSDLESKITVVPNKVETDPIILETPDVVPPKVTTEIVTDTSSGKPISYLLIYGQDKETAIRSYELVDRADLLQIDTPFELDRGLFTEKTEIIVTDLALNKTRIPVYIPGTIEILGIHPTLFQSLLALLLVLLGAFTLTHILEMHPNAKSRVWPWT